MKKFVVLLVVVAMTCLSAMAYAADVTVGGSYDIRSRAFDNLNVYKDGYNVGVDSKTQDGSVRDTQNRIRIDINAKAGDVKGKLELESDFNTGQNDWGVQGNDFTVTRGLSAYGYSTNGSTLGFREAWLSFNLPFAPINITAGHQLLTLGNGWFFRSMHFGSDAWVVANQTGNNTIAFVNWKVAENSLAWSDDTDAYVILDMFKISDTLTVGADFTNAALRQTNHTGGLDTSGVLQNLGLNMNGKFGPVALKAEFDQQMGKQKNADLYIAPGSPAGTHMDAKYKGNQLVIQGNVGLDPVTINFTAARGTGAKVNQTDYNQFVTFLDIDPHYTFLYEYKVKTASGGKYTGMSNTTALSAGVSAAASKSVTVAADFWLLKATQAVAINGATDPLTGQAATSRDVGMELDVKVNWKIYDNLSWNWVLGYFVPGDAYNRSDPQTGNPTSMDNVTGIQGILSFKF